MDNDAMPPPALPADVDEATQQATQAYSQPESGQVNGHLWGFLLPCSPKLHQIDFWKIQPSVEIGRSTDNLVQLPGMRISESLVVLVVGAYFDAFAYRQ
jgi:serine/threonine/tyrosine protein kinase RAD53